MIGANVLHATPDIDTTSSNVRSLLAPGGQLVLLEGATPQRFGDLTVGLLEGWWAFTDTQRRSYALMPRGRWIEAFVDAGFANPVAIVDEDAGPVLAQQAIYVAQALYRYVCRRDSRRAALARHRIGSGAASTSRVAEIGEDALLLDVDSALAAIGTGSRRDRRRAPRLTRFRRRRGDVGERCGAISNVSIDALSTAQLLASSNDPPALCLVTRGAQATHAGESSDPIQATVWGFSHVVAVEHPELRCRRIDLDASASSDEIARHLLAELRTSSREDQVALRGDRRLVRRLVRLAVSRPTSCL